MATSKTTKTASKQKGGGKQLKKKRAILGDPPIIVGGGGSVYIWMHKSIKPQLIDSTDATNPPPHANNYLCIVCDVDIAGIEADDGIPGAGHKVKPIGDPANSNKVDPKKHKTVFS
jgi:hypothetical protein